MDEKRLQNIRDAVANGTATGDDARELLTALDAERMVRADELALAYEDAAKILNEEKCIGLPVEQMMDWHRRDWQRTMRRRAEEIRERIHGPLLPIRAAEPTPARERMTLFDHRFMMECVRTSWLGMFPEGSDGRRLIGITSAAYQAERNARMCATDVAHRACALLRKTEPRVSASLTSVLYANERELR